MGTKTVLLGALGEKIWTSSEAVKTFFPLLSQWILSPLPFLSQDFCNHSSVEAVRYFSERRAVGMRAASALVLLWQKNNRKKKKERKRKNGGQNEPYCKGCERGGCGCFGSAAQAVNSAPEGGGERREGRRGGQIPTPQRAARLQEISSAFHHRAKVSVKGVQIIK